MQCNAFETGSPQMNKSVFTIWQLQGTLIQLMAFITTVKWQIKSVKND